MLVNHGKAVLQGNLREVKARYGTRTVQVEMETPLEDIFIDVVGKANKQEAVNA